MKAITFTFALLTSLPFYAFADKPSEGEPHQAVATSTPALLCADQADNRIRLINPLAANDNSATLWCYPAESAKPLNYRPTDAKRVEFEGEVFVLAAYHGRVQLVRFRDHQLVKDFSTYSSCHSAELLPDGAIVTVNSNHAMLRLHRSADEYVDLELPYAHGVTWDKTRQCLWVLGDCLYRFDYTEANLSLKSKFTLPGTPTGHDLFPLREEAKLLVSNNDALFLFDITTEEFETVSELRMIKSASQHADGSIWVSDPKDIEGSPDWQSDAVISVFPKGAAKRYTIEGARFYKARWWQPVNFSY
ncbi:MAG: DUF6528 family protein [Novipirellula sp. JB048]